MAEHSPHPWLIADASGTKFIDSTGTGKLVRFARGCRERGGQCILAGCGPLVLQTLALMRLSDFFLFAATLEDALALVPETVVAASLTLVWEDTVTAATLPPLEAEAFELLENLTSGAALTVDLTALRFIDSAGVGLMLRLQRRARQRHVELTFVNASDPVRRVLSLLRVESYLLSPANTEPGGKAA